MAYAKYRAFIGLHKTPGLYILTWIKRLVTLDLAEKAGQGLRGLPEEIIQAANQKMGAQLRLELNHIVNCIKLGRNRDLSIDSQLSATSVPDAFLITDDMGNKRSQVTQPTTYPRMVQLMISGSYLLRVRVHYKFYN